MTGVFGSLWLVEASASNDSTGLMKSFSPVVMDFSALSSMSAATSDPVAGALSDACSTSRRLGRTAGLPVCRSQRVMSVDVEVDDDDGLGL